jgi:hypothetical protein
MQHLFWYQKGRILARFHVQVELDSVPAVTRTPGRVRVAARVIRVFRGAADLRVGEPVKFAVSVRRPLDDVPDGATLWTDFDALRGARFMEVYLGGKPPNCFVPRWQSKIIQMPCDSPALPCTPAESLSELVDVFVDSCFQGRCVRARTCNNPGEASALRFENALRSIDAAPLEHQGTSEDKGAGDCQFRVGDDTLTVYRDARAIDVEGPPALVLRVMYAMYGLPIALDSPTRASWPSAMYQTALDLQHAIWGNTSETIEDLALQENTTETIEDPARAFRTSLTYANELTQAGQYDSALFMLDLAIPGLDRLALNEGRKDLLETFATALITKGIVTSRLSHDATAQTLLQQANELLARMAEDGLKREVVYRWVGLYLDLAKQEDRTGKHRSAALLFGQAVALFEWLVNKKGRHDLAAQLAMALVDQASALMQLGEVVAAVPLVTRDSVVELPGGPWVLVHHLVENQVRLTAEQTLAGEQFVEHHAETVDIATVIHGPGRRSGRGRGVAGGAAERPAVAGPGGPGLPERVPNQGYRLKKR